MKLYTRWQNSAGERVRIALNLKGLTFEYVAVESLPAGRYGAINPQILMPTLEVDERKVNRWVHHWLTDGFETLEAMLTRRPTQWNFCFGEAPGWADLHLVPQLANGRRLGLDLSAYTHLLAVERECAGIDAFARARPEVQPDYPGA